MKVDLLTSTLVIIGDWIRKEIHRPFNFHMHMWKKLFTLRITLVNELMTDFWAKSSTATFKRDQVKPKAQN